MHVDRSGHGDDIDLRIPDRFKVSGVIELRRFGELCRLNLSRAVLPGLQFHNAVQVDVEANGRAPLAELDGERQADITQSNNGN